MLKPLWKWIADGPKTWADFVIMSDLREKQVGKTPLQVRAKLEADWLITLDKADRPSAIASILERCYPDDTGLQTIASILRNSPRKKAIAPTARRYEKAVEVLAQEEQLTRTAALDKLARYLNDRAIGSKTRTAESLRVEISKYKNSTQTEP